MKNKGMRITRGDEEQQCVTTRTRPKKIIKIIKIE
jgi:hypothetical protein